MDQLFAFEQLDVYQIARQYVKNVYMLSWIHKCKTEAIKRFNPKSQSTSYYWVEQYVKEEKTRRWIEASVAHLGVRLVWVNEYSDIVDVLTKSIK